MNWKTYFISLSSSSSFPCRLHECFQCSNMSFPMCVLSMSYCVRYFETTLKTFIFSFCLSDLFVKQPLLQHTMYNFSSIDGSLNDQEAVLFTSSCESLIKRRVTGVTPFPSCLFLYWRESFLSPLLWPTIIITLQSNAMTFNCVISSHPLWKDNAQVTREESIQSHSHLRSLPSLPFSLSLSQQFITASVKEDL